MVISVVEVVVDVVKVNMGYIKVYVLISGCISCFFVIEGIFVIMN